MAANSQTCLKLSLNSVPSSAATSKGRAAASTHKKVVVGLTDKSVQKGYLNPSRLGQADPMDLLTPDGEYLQIPLERVRTVHFVRDFSNGIEVERKMFLSRPKLDGLWVRLRFRDGETLEGVAPNNLLSLLDQGIQITPPDPSAGSDRIFVPRGALAEVTVLGVVGIARRKPAAAVDSQPRLFTD